MNLEETRFKQIYGHLVKNIDFNGPTISPEDLSRHMYLVGGSGCGKTTLIRHLSKHLEITNLSGTMKSAFVYIDVKDEDAKLFLRQSEQTSIEKGNVIFLDINHTNFAINLLELPRYIDGKSRENTIARKIGNVMDMFKEFYDQQQTFVRMERILKLLLNYLYQNTDSPTMLDLYQIIVRLQRDGTDELARIRQHLKNVSAYEMDAALESIAGLKSDSWEPLLNRIEPFATDSYLRKVFSVRRSTIDFAEMLKPGRQTFIRISDTETPHYATGLAIMGIVIGIWFSLQERAARTSQPSSERNLVVLCLDEFQRVQSLSILRTMLEQARSYNLGLVLSHQNLRQIDDVLLGATAGNTATQIYGRVAGQDASKIARNIDPKFSTELTDQIATQPDFQFTIKTRAPIGEEQETPQKFRALPPPELKMPEEEAEKYNEIMKIKYGRKETEEIRSIFEGQDESTKWMLQLEDPSAFLPQEEWKIVIALKDGHLNLSDIVEKTGSNDRDSTSEILDKMLARELVRISSAEKKGAVTMKVYDITDRTRSRYFPASFDTLGRGAKDIQQVAQTAFDYHLAKGDYIAIAGQDMRNGRDRTDLVSYEYSNKAPISIEIESEEEVYSHPEQVLYNMKKWRLLGFARCEVWTKSKVVEDIYERLDPELKKDVSVHIVV